MNIRSLYVSTLRGMRLLLRPTGVLEWLEQRDNRYARWVRSLFAIYDLDDLIKVGLPWWTFDAVDAVEEILAENPQARVFEWGSGASTLWLAARAKEVISIEHDTDWVSEVQARLDAIPEGPKVTLRYVGWQSSGKVGSRKRGFEDKYFDEYVNAIHEVGGLFDLIVIDGRAREACLVEAASHLAPGGRILFDDFKRQRYRNAVKLSGMSADRKDGLAVCLPFPDSTALLSPSA